MKQFLRSLLWGIVGLFLVTMVTRQLTRRRNKTNYDDSMLSKRFPVSGRKTIWTVAAPTGELRDRLLSEYPPNAFEDVQVIELDQPSDGASLWTAGPQSRAGGLALWAASSTGMRNYDISPLPSHFVRVFEYMNDSWVEKSRQDLDSVFYGGGPDYLPPTGVHQVSVEPEHLWLEVKGGAGFHGGTYALMMYDNDMLSIQAVNTNEAPDAGALEDINADGVPELLLNFSNPNILSYASGVRWISYRVMSWEPSLLQFVEVPLAMMPEGAPPEVREPANRAVKLAWVELWKDAKISIDEARQAAAQIPGFDSTGLNWVGTLIDLHAGKYAQAVSQSAFPLITNVFYGDYPAAVDVLRSYPPEQIFTEHPAVFVGSAAEGFEFNLREILIKAADRVVSELPNLAPAYFLRAWGFYLFDPSNSQALDDVTKAAALDPGDQLFTGCANFLTQLLDKRDGSS